MFQQFKWSGAQIFTGSGDYLEKYIANDYGILDRAHYQMSNTQNMIYVKTLLETIDFEVALSMILGITNTRINI